MFSKCATEAEYVVQAPAQSAGAANFVLHMMWQLCVPCACVRFYFFLRETSLDSSFQQFASRLI